MTINKLPIGNSYAADAGNDPVLYVDDLNGKDTNAGTITNPFKTLYRALDIINIGYTGNAIINLLAGSQTTVVLDEDLLINASGDKLTINGSENTEVTGTADGGTMQVEAPFAFGTLVDSTQAWTVDAFKGMTLELTSGTLSGFKTTISTNDATTLTFTSSPSGITAVTTEGYRIFSRINAFDASGITVKVKGCACFNNFSFINATSDDLTFDICCELLMIGCEISGSSVVVAVGVGRFALGASSIFKVGASTTINTIGGYLDSVSMAIENEQVFIAGTVIELGSLIFINNRSKITSCSISGSGLDFRFNDGAITSISLCVCLTTITIEDNSSGNIVNVNFDGSTARAITVDKSNIYLDNVRGTVTGDYGLYLTKGSMATIEGTPSVTGTTGDIRLGSTGTKTWVLALGGLAVNTSDYADASPEYCIVATQP